MGTVEVLMFPNVRRKLVNTFRLFSVQAGYSSSEAMSHRANDLKFARKYQSLQGRCVYLLLIRRLVFCL